MITRGGQGGERSERKGGDGQARGELQARGHGPAVEQVRA